MSKIDELFDYYLKNQDKLVESCNGKFIVIKNFNVVGCFDSEADAYFDSVDRYGIGNFIIQYCISGVESYTQHFSSRVKFN